MRIRVPRQQVREGWPVLQTMKHCGHVERENRPEGLSHSWTAKGRVLYRIGLDVQVCTAVTWIIVVLSLESQETDRLLAHPETVCPGSLEPGVSTGRHHPRLDRGCAGRDFTSSWRTLNNFPAAGQLFRDSLLPKSWFRSVDTFEKPFALPAYRAYQYIKTIFPRRRPKCLPQNAIG
jgi:hypothetical protein